MSRVDITVALTAHAETVVAGPTMQSAELAIARAEEAGFTTQRLIGFDNPSDGCRQFFEQAAFDEWQKHSFDFRDQGKTRNALTQSANGRWLAFLDGDDLFSENWLSEAAQVLSNCDEGQSVIVHPELNWGFDADNFILKKIPDDDPLYSSYYFAVANYYDALAMAPQHVYLDNPFADRAIKEGFALEDWQWSIETMAAGCRHVIAKDTIIFKRRRDSSQTHERERNSAIIRAVAACHVDQLHRLGKQQCVVEAYELQRGIASNASGSGLRGLLLFSQA